MQVVEKVDPQSPDSVIETIVNFVKAADGDFDHIGKLANAVSDDDSLQKMIDFLSRTPQGKQAFGKRPMLGDIDLEKLHSLGARTVIDGKAISISLFTGAYGLDLGLEQAGFHTVTVVEKDRDAVKTIALNRPFLQESAIAREIQNVTSQQLLDDLVIWNQHPEPPQMISINV